MNKTLAKHLAAIESGKVTRTNVIGLRKTFNAFERIRRGYSIGATCPAPSHDDMREIISALEKHRPAVAGQLHDTGIAILNNPRYEKRMRDYRDSIAAIDHFRLIRFDETAMRTHAPVFQAWSRIPPKGDSLDGGFYLAFTFWNVPWQSGGDGPEIQKG